MRLKPNTLPVRCPICDDKHTGVLAVKIHNEIAAQTGCRAYPVKKS